VLKLHIHTQVAHPVTFVAMHFHGHRATCDCIVITDKTTRQ